MYWKSYHLSLSGGVLICSEWAAFTGVLTKWRFDTGTFLVSGLELISTNVATLGTWSDWLDVSAWGITGISCDKGVVFFSTISFSILFFFGIQFSCSCIGIECQPLYVAQTLYFHKLYIYLWMSAHVSSPNHCLQVGRKGRGWVWSCSFLKASGTLQTQTLFRLPGGYINIRKYWRQEKRRWEKTYFFGRISFNTGIKLSPVFIPSKVQHFWKLFFNASTPSTR